jgi:hypothetical protein
MTLLVSPVILSVERRIPSTPTSSIRGVTTNMLHIPVCQLHSCSSTLNTSSTVLRVSVRAIRFWNGREGGYFVQRLHCTCSVYMSKTMTGKGRRVLCYQAFDVRLSHKKWPSSQSFHPTYHTLHVDSQRWTITECFSEYFPYYKPRSLRRSSRSDMLNFPHIQFCFCRRMI